MILSTLNSTAMIEKRDKICRARGGESCAFDGAMIVLQPIADTVHLVHGPISCCANSWQTRGTISTKGNFHKMGFTTDLSELDIILGSEEKLNRALEHIALKVKPQAIFVYSTCVTGLLGEDIERICLNAAERLKIDVIPVNAPGFVGPKNLGNRIAGDILLKYVIGREEPPHTTERDINIIGEYNIAGDQFFIEPLVEESGFRILSRITGNSTLREIKWAHRARLNVVVCSRALVNVAIEMEKRYSIPFVEVSFFSKTEIARALRKIAYAFADNKYIEKVERLIEREERKLDYNLLAYQHIRGKRAVLYTGGVKSWSMISTLKDLGLEVVAVGLKKSTHEDELKIKELVDVDCQLFEDTSPANILRIMKEKRADILIAGGRNQYLAIKEGFPFVDVNQERHRAYAGYKGLINLAEDISRVLKFYSSQRNVKPLITESKASSFIDPLKNSPFIGAVMALQGVDRTMPILHAAQGCNFLGKVLLIKHFREPISMTSSKLFTEEVVMGGKEKLIKVVENFAQKGAKILALITGALSHMRGEDIEEVVNLFKNSDFKVLHIPLPDYEGGMQWGYKETVSRLLNLIPFSTVKKKAGQINIIAGGHLTPADFAELKEIVKSFGLKPIILPDLSFLEGSRDFPSITKGGTALEEVGQMGSSEFTVVIGNSLAVAGEIIKKKTGTDFKVIGSLCGIRANDEFMEILSSISGQKIPERFLRERRILIDTMRDAHFELTGKTVAMALESDMALHLSSLICEMGMAIKFVVVPEKSEDITSLPAEQVIVGSLSNLNENYDLLISNSHAKEKAKTLRVPLYEMGFPVYRTFGYTHKVTIGYRGSLNIVCDMVNLLAREVH
ncbi:nitrogenase iron-molybdenum cofactor biosynthesis protein NifE [Thermodesulfovibrio sp. TK110]